MAQFIAAIDAEVQIAQHPFLVVTERQVMNVQHILIARKINFNLEVHAARRRRVIRPLPFFPTV
jgi:hypothetical protein